MIIASSFVIVHDLDVPGRAFPPFAANAPLLVDTSGAFFGNAEIEGARQQRTQTSAYSVLVVKKNTGPRLYLQ
jgi:hypothetical protein